ncbi:DUF2187 family protein [Bacillus sp. EB600]|nr:DUF2187 family protein [Bacillus sp. EB600]
MQFKIGGNNLIFNTKKKAEIGDHIFFKNGIKGIVEKVNENSVIVKITKNKTELEFEENRTVVSHKIIRLFNCAYCEGKNQKFHRSDKNSFIEQSCSFTHNSLEFDTFLNLIGSESATGV